MKKKTSFTITKEYKAGYSGDLTSSIFYIQFNRWFKDNLSMNNGIVQIYTLLAHNLHFVSFVYFAIFIYSTQDIISGLNY